MNALRSSFLVVLVVLCGLVGCAAPMPYMGSGGYAGQTDRYNTGYGYQQPIPAGYANAHTPYMGMHGGRCYHHGFIQPTNELCLGGSMIQTPAAHVPSQAMQSASPYGGSAPSLDGSMSPEMATELLAELERQPNPCTARESTTRTMIGTAIGAVVGAVIAGGRNHNRGAIIGGLIGAAGGNSSADWTCQRYTDTKLALRATIDRAKARCRDELHQVEVDGRLVTRKTRDCGATEARDFERIGS